MKYFRAEHKKKNIYLQMTDFPKLENRRELHKTDIYLLKTIFTHVCKQKHVS